MVTSIIVVAILVVSIGLVFKFAGGTEADIRSPYPKGDNSLVHIAIPFKVIASQTDKCMQELTVPFSFTTTGAKAYLSAHAIAITNGIALSIEDDTGTPKVIAAVAAATAAAAGSTVEEALTVTEGNEIFAGAQVRVMTTSGASDTIDHGVINLWVKPLR